MKKLILLMALATSLSVSANSITCLKAGGFYGNLTFNKTKQQSSLKLKQGFAGEISKALNLPITTNSFKLVFKNNRCLLKGKNVVCKDRVNIIATSWGKLVKDFKGVALFSLKNDTAKVILKATGKKKVSITQHFFSELSPLDGCN